MNCFEVKQTNNLKFSQGIQVMHSRYIPTTYKLCVLEVKYMSRAMRKRVFGHMPTTKVPVSMRMNAV